VFEDCLVVMLTAEPHSRQDYAARKQSGKPSIVKAGQPCGAEERLVPPPACSMSLHWLWRIMGSSSEWRVSLHLHISYPLAKCCPKPTTWK